MCLSWFYGSCLLLMVLLFDPVHEAFASDNATVESSGTQVLWTNKPVRVDQKKQNLPRAVDRRLSDAFPEVFYVPKSVRVSDSVTFRIRNEEFRLAYLDPVPPQMVCRAEDGTRWSCGLRSRMNLRSMIAGKQIKCRRVNPPEADIPHMNCIIGYEQTLAANLLRSGSATPVGRLPEDLGEAANFAIETRAGIWSDGDYYKSYLDRTNNE
jgi:endonuclease YncB( thermonuclease family)